MKKLFSSSPVFKLIFISLFLIILKRDVSPQVYVLNEDSKENTYYITYHYKNSNYQIIRKNQTNFLHFPNTVDESRPGEFILPEYDIFIAIPFNSRPSVRFQVDEKLSIDALPEQNPVVSLNADKTLRYEEYSGLPEKKSASDFEVKGYLWINNNYCMHVVFHPFGLNENQRTVYQITRFSVSLSFNQPVQLSQRSAGKDDLISNGRGRGSFSHKPVFDMQRNDGWIDYDKYYVKIGTARDGIYRIGYNDLQSLGVDPAGIDPKTFKLFMKGKQIPIYVSGEQDNQFNNGDYIEFPGQRNMGVNHRQTSAYGKPYNEYLDRYSDTTIYWLNWGGTLGQRVSVYSGTENLTSADTLLYYNSLVHIEKNNWFDFSMADQVRRESPFWYENKTWHEGNLSVSTRSITFPTSDIFPGKPVGVYCKLQDFASNLSKNSHLLAIGLNSSAVQDSGYLDKYQQKVLSGVFNSSQMLKGNNTLKVYSYATKATINTCIVDWYELEYPRYLKMTNDTLGFSFTFLGGSSVRTAMITGASGNGITVWKYSDGYRKYNVLPNQGTFYITDTLSAKSSFIAASEQKILKPVVFYIKKFTNLRSEENSADYIAITHKKFYSKTNDYARFISQQYNIRTKVVDIDDIYDEFSYGFFNPECIRDFLKVTHSAWGQPSADYVVLIGAATYDYHHNKTRFMNNPPTYNYVPSFGASVSDNWFVIWDSTGAYIPQMNIGRLPVNSNEELQSYFDKHMNYVSKGYDEWSKRYIFFSGGTGDNQYQLDQLRNVNQYIIDNVIVQKPVGGDYRHFYKTITPKTNFGPYTTAEVQKTIEQGAVAISYLGHSGTRTWDNSITEPSHLKNKVDRSPLITDFGCSTARFAEPDVVSFSQLFVTGIGGQAIAYIGNSSLGFLSTSLSFPQIFYKRLFTDSVGIISKAHKEGKMELVKNYGNSGVYQLFTLTNTYIGDPIVKLPLPPKPDLSVSAKDIAYSPEIPSDDLDSIKLVIKYRNWGKALSDSFTIHIEDTYQGQKKFSVSVARQLPFFTDSLMIGIPVRKLAGQHLLRISLDSGGRIDEVSENNNSLEMQFTVASASVKSTLNYENENGLNSGLTLLNPSVKPESSQILMEYDENPSFSSRKELSVEMDTFMTRLTIPNLSQNKRYWFRINQNNDSYTIPRSFIYSDESKYLLADSLSLAKNTLRSLAVKKNRLSIDTLHIKYSVLSAGMLDGRMVSIQKDAQELVPENTLLGHHICILEDSTFKFIKYLRYDLLNNSNSSTEYIKMLDTLGSKYLILVAVGDDGRVGSAALRDKLKQYGSSYIDSVEFRGSWAFIGKKGAAPGSVPEAFSRPGKGSVHVDTVFNLPQKSGELLTGIIGPSRQWNKLKVVQNLPENAAISYLPVAIGRAGNADTLGAIEIKNGYADLSGIDAEKYPNIKLLARFTANASGLSPEIISMGVNYTGVPELGLNYQVVSLSKDTVDQGNKNLLKFFVCNAGESRSDSVRVVVDLLRSNNTTRTVMDTIVAGVDSFSMAPLKYEYLSNVHDTHGNMAFIVRIDPEDKIREMYEDNNSYKVPFFVKPDTSVVAITDATLKVTYDGKEIMDGDYVSPDPEIILSLSYPVWFPYSDTTAISVKLDQQRLYFSSLSHDFDTIGRKAEYRYLPKLSNGEHTLEVHGNNVYGNLENLHGYRLTFNVTDQSRLLDVYNYPNPVTSNTSFTFRLTKVPEELRIKVYTVAGRLVREITGNTAALSPNFNHIPFDCRDQDGNHLANGVYLYKVIIKDNGSSQSVVQKMAIVR